VLEPAIKLASSGFYADEFFAYAVRDSQKELSKYEDWVKYFGHIDRGAMWRTRSWQMSWIPYREGSRGNSMREPCQRRSLMILREKVSL